MEKTLLKEKNIISDDVFNKIEIKDYTEVGQANLPVPYKKPESPPKQAVKILKEHGYDNSKIFCYADPNNLTSVFSVLSNRWDWDVMPLLRHTINEVPDEYLQGVQILLHHRIEIKSLAIGKPKPKESVSGVFHQEFQNAMSIIASTSKGFLSFIEHLILGSVNGVKTVTKSIDVALVDIPDPVLLARIENVWIEIGRWE